MQKKELWPMKVLTIKDGIEIKTKQLDTLKVITFNVNQDLLSK